MIVIPVLVTGTNRTAGLEGNAVFSAISGSPDKASGPRRERRSGAFLASPDIQHLTTSP